MRITKTQLKQIIKEELGSTLKEAASPIMPDSPGLLRAIWDMLKDAMEKDEDFTPPRSPEEDPDRWRPSRELSPEEKEDQEEVQRRSKARVASSARDAYYHGGTYDPTLEEMIKEEIEKILKR